MTALGTAFKYCYYTIGEIFNRPRVLIALLFSFVESLVSASVTLALTTIILHFFRASFWGLFLIGVIMAVFLIALCFIYQLLKARAIYAYTSRDPIAHHKLFPPLAWDVLRYSHKHLLPWSDTFDDETGWQKGRHLVLPLMVTELEPYERSLERLEELKRSRTLTFNPNKVAIKPLTIVFSLASLLLGIVIGAWLGFSAASGIVVPFIRQIQAAGFALLVFLAISWLPSALSAVKNAFYQTDLLLVEQSVSDQPGLLAHAQKDRAMS